MAYTYTTLKQAIQDWLENTETTFVSQIPTFVGNAEERILKESQLQEFRKNATASMTSDNKYFPKPTDWLASYSMSILNSDTEHVFLLNKDVNFLQMYAPDPTATGEPKYYADYDVDSFIVAPTPDSAYVAELHYLYRPTSIVDAGTTWIGTNAQDVLLYACLIEGYTYMKGEPDLLQQYTQRYIDSLLRLKNFGEGLEPNDSLRRGVIRTNPR